MHADELIGQYRLPDTRQIRAYFEENPDDFEAALEEYRAWKQDPGFDWAEQQSRQIAVLRHSRRVGAVFHDWTCVLKFAALRLDRGLPCPPWWTEE